MVRFNALFFVSIGWIDAFGWIMVASVFLLKETKETLNYGWPVGIRIQDCGIMMHPIYINFPIVIYWQSPVCICLRIHVILIVS